jgi:hypothetical protein
MKKQRQIFSGERLCPWAKPCAARMAVLPALLLFAACCLTTSTAHCQTVRSPSLINREYTIKAAYLYNFANYVEWPSSVSKRTNVPFVIGVVGPYPFGKHLDVIAATKKIDGRKIVIRRFKTLDDYTTCDILFIAGSDPRKHPDLDKRLGKSPVLLVGESSLFAQRGGTISFFVQQNKVRFKINQQAAKRKGLKISSKLLQMAELVKDNKES